MAADIIAQRILSAAESLAESPYIGRPGRIADTRERVVLGTPYVIVYRVTDQVEIQGVFHGRQRWPERL